MLVFLLGTNCTRHGLEILACSYATAFANRLLACDFDMEALSKLAIPWFFDDFIVVNDRLPGIPSLAMEIENERTVGVRRVSTVASTTPHDALFPCERAWRIT